MTESDIQRVERELGVSLPGDYRSMLGAYPFAADSWPAEFVLLDSADGLLELNRQASIPLPPQSFVIGTDGGEATFFISLSRQSSPVFVFDLESGDSREESPSVAAYVESCRREEAESKRESLKTGERRWWEIWK